MRVATNIQEQHVFPVLCPLLQYTSQLGRWPVVGDAGTSFSCTSTQTWCIFSSLILNLVLIWITYIISLSNIFKLKIMFQTLFFYLVFFTSFPNNVLLCSRIQFKIQSCIAYSYPVWIISSNLHEKNF